MKKRKEEKGKEIQVITMALESCWKLTTWTKYHLDKYREASGFLTEISYWHYLKEIQKQSLWDMLTPELHCVRNTSDLFYKQPAFFHVISE